jgi:peptide deformylase
MEIIKPLDNRISAKVKSWREIKKEALELKEFLEAKKFEGHWEDAYAISHTQVSKDPKSFFVVNQKVREEFGSWCIVNLKITNKRNFCTYPEGCMSFMFRTAKRVDRYINIKAFYWVPFLNLFLIPKWKSFKSLPAFICQHESDHAKGINIYGL